MKIQIIDRENTKYLNNIMRERGYKLPDVNPEKEKKNCETISKTNIEMNNN